MAGPELVARVETLWSDAADGADAASSFETGQSVGAVGVVVALHGGVEVRLRRVDAGDGRVGRADQARRALARRRVEADTEGEGGGKKRGGGVEAFRGVCVCQRCQFHHSRAVRRWRAWVVHVARVDALLPDAGLVQVAVAVHAALNVVAFLVRVALKKKKSGEKKIQSHQFFLVQEICRSNDSHPTQRDTCTATGGPCRSRWPQWRRGCPGCTPPRTCCCGRPGRPSSRRQSRTPLKKRKRVWTS